MARVLVTLLAANLLAFLWLRGTFDDYLGAGRDPERLSLQVEANRLQVIGGERPPAGALPAQPAGTASGSPMPVPPVPAASGGAGVLVCNELSALDESALVRVRAFFSEYPTAYSTEIQAESEPPLLLVYTLPVEDQAAAQRKLIDFRRQGFENLAIIQTGKYRLGMSFGTFRTEDQARALVERLTQRGVRNLRIGQLEPAILRASVRYRYSANEAGPTTEARDKLAALLTQLVLSPKPCDPPRP